MKKREKEDLEDEDEKTLVPDDRDEILLDEDDASPNDRRRDPLRR